MSHNEATVEATPQQTWEHILAGFGVLHAIFDPLLHARKVETLRRLGRRATEQPSAG